MNENRIKAVCLLSGGLDSSLAMKLVKEQGIEVIAVNFTGPFIPGREEPSESAASRVADSMGIDLRIIELGEEYLDVLKSPKYGYGSNMNPCIDCRIYMLKKAKETMLAEGASFVVTGEVIGQRPMTQRKEVMKRTERESGLEGLILRPLSAQGLDPTIPEIRGWIRREHLLGITGRSRKQQMKIAEQTRLVGYSCPGGGCLLTDPAYAERVRDLIRHDMLTLHDVDLLSIGRHFRLPGGSKLIVGRNERENQLLESKAVERDMLLVTESCPGPSAILRGPRHSEEAGLGARIVARYSDAMSGIAVSVRIESATGTGTELATSLPPENVRELMI
jgi:tRNA-specific 2-thiouridylase